MERALLIEWNQRTGKRAGDINPRDPKLQCYGWQNMDVSPALEIRLVEDDRDLSQYEAVAGVTLLEGKEAIDQAIRANIPMVRCAIKSDFWLREDMKEKGVPVSIFKGMSSVQMAQEAHKRGLLGAVERKTKLLE